MLAIIKGCSYINITDHIKIKVIRNEKDYDMSAKLLL